MRRGALWVAMAMAMAACCAQAQEASPRFDGGMMVSVGYSRATIAALDYRASGVATGIGGVARFHLGQHLRLGGEGYVSTLRPSGNGSLIRLGWGGLVAEWGMRRGRWLPYAGLTVGGGSASTLLVLEGDDSDWMPEPRTVLHNEGFLLLDPHVGAEYLFSPTLRLTARIGHLLPLSRPDIPTGFRLSLGIIFAH